MFKLSFHDYKELKKRFSNMSQKDLTFWINHIYEKGFEEGYKACQNEPGEVMDWVLVKTAIRSAEGLSNEQKEVVIKTIDGLCFEEKEDKSEKS